MAINLLTGKPFNEPSDNNKKPSKDEIEKDLKAAQKEGNKQAIEKYEKMLKSLGVKYTKKS